MPKKSFETLHALPKSKLQPPVSTKPQRLSMREAKKAEQVKLPVPDWRTISLDSPALELPLLDEEVWGSESPYIVKASGVEHTSRFSYHRGVMSRQVYCVGDAQFYAVLHLERICEGILIENPFQLKSAGKTCKLTFLTAPGFWQEEGLAIPWHEVQLWHPVSVTMLAPGNRGERKRLQLLREVDLYTELAEAAGCEFQVLVVERPGHPPASRSLDYLAELPCSVEIITRARRENLLLLKRHEVCLGGRDETLLDSLIWLFLDGPDRATVTEMAEVTGVSRGRITEAVLHASFHGVLSFDLDQPYNLSSSQFSLSGDWQAVLMRLRGWDTP